MVEIIAEIDNSKCELEFTTLKCSLATYTSLSDGFHTKNKSEIDEIHSQDLNVPRYTTATGTNAINFVLKIPRTEFTTSGKYVKRSYALRFIGRLQESINCCS